jgi:histidine triad (HIT) family protein
MTDCIFCRILTGGLPASVVYRDDHAAAFLDIRPVNEGHLLVVPTRHADYLADLDPAVGGHLFAVAQRAAGALRASGVRCEGVNLHLADGEAAGQEVFHVHLHVIPRFRGDGAGFRAGRHYGHTPDRAELDALAGRLRAAIDAASG